MKYCNNCAVPESNKCDAVNCPPACNGAEDACPCFNASCFKAGGYLNRELSSTDSLVSVQNLIILFQFVKAALDVQINHAHAQKEIVRVQIDKFQTHTTLQHLK